MNRTKLIWTGVLAGVFVAGCAWTMLDQSAVSDPLSAVGGRGSVYVAEHRPELTAEQLAAATPAQLLAFYAPVYVQQYADKSKQGIAYPHDSDLFGRPYLVRTARGGWSTRIDVSQPVVYGLYQRRKLGQRVHVQLTYTLWYPRHPRTKKVDIEPGNIDSNVVRITLDDQNRPLLYETVLACGCYHKVFAERRVEEASRATWGPPERGKTYSLEKNIPLQFDFEVAGLVDTPLDRPAPPVVFISSGEHKVLGLQSSADLNWEAVRDGVRSYHLADYRELESVPIAGTDRRGSIFNPGNDQQVWGADRAERYIFMWIGTDDAGHPRRNDQILLHFDQSRWMDPQLFWHYLRMPRDF